MWVIVITWCPSLSASSSLNFYILFFSLKPLNHIRTKLGRDVHWNHPLQSLCFVFRFCWVEVHKIRGPHVSKGCVHFYIYGHKLFIVLMMNCFNAFLNSLRKCFFRSRYNMFFSAIFVFDIKEVKRGRRKNWPLRFLFNFHAVFYQVFILVSYWWAIILLFFYYFFLGGGGGDFISKRGLKVCMFFYGLLYVLSVVCRHISSIFYEKTPILV